MRLLSVAFGGVVFVSGGSLDGGSDAFLLWDLLLLTLALPPPPPKEDISLLASDVSGEALSGEDETDGLVARACRLPERFRREAVL